MTPRGQDEVRLEAPMFGSAHAALSWAYAPRSGSESWWAEVLGRWMARDWERRRIVRWDGERTPVPRGMDGAAQAAMIQSWVRNHLLPIHAAWIEATYTVGHRRTEAQWEIVQAIVKASGTGVHRRRMLLTLVKRWFGKPCNLGDLATEHGVHRNTVGNAVRTVDTVLCGLRDAAMTAATDGLRAQRVIE